MGDGGVAPLKGNVVSTIRNRPVTSFLLIVFAVSYVLGIPFNLAASAMFDSTSLAGIYLPRLLTVIGPAVAALVVARSGGGTITAVRLFRSLRFQVRDLSWIVSAAVVGLVSASVAFVLAGLPPAKLVEFVATCAPLLFGHVLLQVTMVGVGEELGWRGWLLPTLSATRSFLAATALTGLAWTLWHLPLFLSGLSIAVSTTVLTASLAITFSWLWHRTAGNIGVIALAHGFVNAPFFFLEQLVRPMPDAAALTARAFAYFAGSYSAVALALAVQGCHIWRDRSAAWQGVEEAG
jgi:membrane protease YdiL (CAAX protease family)